MEPSLSSPELAEKSRHNLTFTRREYIILKGAFSSLLALLHTFISFFRRFLPPKTSLYVDLSHTKCHTYFYIFFPNGLFCYTEVIELKLDFLSPSLLPFHPLSFPPSFPPSLPSLIPFVCLSVCPSLPSPLHSSVRAGNKEHGRTQAINKCRGNVTILTLSELMQHGAWVLITDNCSC